MATDMDVDDSFKPDIHITIQADGSSKRTSCIIEAMHAEERLPREMLNRLMDNIAFGKSHSSEPSPTEKAKYKTRQDFLEEMIIRHAAGATPSRLPSQATPEQRAAERQRVLNVPTTRHRIIFSEWPRPPDSKKCITPDNSLPGKTAPNKLQLWGATLFDFYHVNRIVTIKNLVTTSTGSKLAAWVKAQGEDGYEPAKGMLEWAEDEADPEVVEPCDIAQLIQDGEAAQRRRIESVGMKRAQKGKNDEDTEMDEEAKNEEEVQMDDFEFHKTVDSIFAPSAYPKDWISEPFTDWKLKWMPIAQPHTLQKYIPQSCLPKKLVVHDPWRLLHVSGVRDREEWEKDVQLPWSEKKDITHTYKLKTSEKHTDRMKEDGAERAVHEAKEKAILEKFLADPHTKNEAPRGFEMLRHGETEPGPVRPAIYVVLPSLPWPVPAKEGHLYLSPAHTIGEGNHSMVYNAEWELPRSLLVEQELCSTCIAEDVEELMKEQLHPDGSPFDPKYDEKSGRLYLKTRAKAPLTMTLDGNKDDVYLLEEGYYGKTLEYEGSYQVFQSRVRYQNLENGPYCKHLNKTDQSVHPLTAKVSVAAKLSIQYDGHLANEANNYQRFPKHFFEHYTGYNVIRPILEPVPLGPLVPQYYGHYVVDEEEYKPARANDEAGPTDTNPRKYLSPILLVEKCGIPIEPAELSIDDKQECASLVYRFHEASWIHGSVAKRNILRQPGPLSQWPVQRMFNNYDRGGYGVGWSFRLIDFGRSSDTRHVEARKSNDMIRTDAQKITNWINDFGELD
ncbi:hypothetical protein BDZ97DRAFT_259558 [Flammula alnicola]|nr:hypothetical protein BDZ97DRAFT_259558 [Flammula alnicola]